MEGEKDEGEARGTTRMPKRSSFRRIRERETRWKMTLERVDYKKWGDDSATGREIVKQTGKVVGPVV